jgi:hypothetical protein
LILSLILPVGLTIGYLKLQQIQVRKEVKKDLISAVGNRAQLLERFVFHVQDITSILDWKDAHEFSYQGRMFDVVSSKKTKDSIYLICWPDNKESQINQQLQFLVNQTLHQNTQRNHSKNQLIVFLSSWYWEKSRLEAFYPKSLCLLFIHGKVRLSPKIYLELPTPPPRVA